MIAKSNDWHDLPDPDQPDRKPSQSTDDDRESNDPTPRQIRKRAARIRRDWTEAKKKSRAVQPKDEPWQPPRISNGEWNEDSTSDSDN